MVPGSDPFYVHMILYQSPCTVPGYRPKLLFKCSLSQVRDGKRCSQVGSGVDISEISVPGGINLMHSKLQPLFTNRLTLKTFLSLTRPNRCCRIQE